MHRPDILDHLGWLIRPAGVDGWLLCEPAGGVLFACSTQREALDQLSIMMGQVGQPAPSEMRVPVEPTTEGRAASAIAERFKPVANQNRSGVLARNLGLK